MRPLTDTTPKPLLPVRGRPMIEWHLLALAEAGVKRVVINTAWLEAQFPDVLGDGSRFGLELRYSTEGRDHGGALETAGGIRAALSSLGDAFWVVSGDIFVPHWRFDPAQALAFAQSPRLAHLWLVPNPEFHPRGDFGLSAEGLGLADGPGPDGRTYTYANLALCKAELVAHLPLGQRAALGPLLFEGMRAGRIGAELYAGEWHNVGTPAQWQALQTAA